MGAPPPPHDSRSRPTRRLLAAAVLWLGAAALRAGPEDFPPAIAPQPAVLAFAASHGFAVGGIDPPGEPGPGTIGDAISALVTLHEGARSRQWLVEFKIGLAAANPGTAHSTFTVGVNGHNFKFSADATTPLNIRVAGPFADGRKPPAAEVRARAPISPDFLGLGLDSFCRVFIELKRANPASFADPGSKPAGPPPVIADGDLRTVAGGVPALMSFVQGIAQTPGLREILFSIVDKPSAWSVIKRGGKLDLGFNLGSDSAEVDPAGRLLPASPLYRLPFTLNLNQQPALRCVLYVMAPRPSLVATAGVVGDASLISRPN